VPSFLSVPIPYRWLVTLAFVTLTVVLSVTPGRAQPGDSIFAWLVVNTPTPVQKTLHIGVYAVLAMLWMWTFDALESNRLRIVLALTLTIGLGTSLEWYQTTVPGRFGTLTDVLLNIAGAVAGLLFILVLF